MAVVLVFSSMMLTIQAFRVHVLNFLISVEPEYTSYELQDSDENSNENEQLIVNWVNTYVPTYIPDGYRVSEMSYSDAEKEITLENENSDSTIIYSEFESGNSISIDTENAALVKTIKLNQHEGTLSVKGSTITIVWKMDQQLFIVQGQISEDEAVKIAEGVKYIK